MDDPDGPEAPAQAICLRQLGHGPRTRAQLATALRRRDVPDDIAGRVLDRLVECGLVDDAAFAAAWVDSRHQGRGLAGAALARELRRRGVDDDVVEGALARLDPASELETAHALVERRLERTRDLQPRARARRLLGMLARKGYPPGLAFRVVREALAAEAAGGTGAGMPDVDGLAEPPDY
ncbi:MAG: regulatory protein RecX [Streptomycetales bacterium]